MRFYLDEHFADEIAVIARNLGADVVTVHECDTEGRPDEWQLLYATSLGRCIVTKDNEDFLDLALSWAEQAQEHAGILIVSRSLPSNHFTAIARALALYHRRHPDDVYPNLFDWLHAAPADEANG